MKLIDIFIELKDGSESEKKELMWEIFLCNYESSKSENKEFIEQEDLNKAFERIYNHSMSVEEFMRCHDVKPEVIHDFTKFSTENIVGYVLMEKRRRLKAEQGSEFSSEVLDEIYKVTENHVFLEKHHPEFWAIEADRDAVSREIIASRNANYRPNEDNIIRLKEIPFEALVETCADWCAMSEEFGNTPYEWFESVNNARWKFTKENVDTILEILDKMW